MSNKRSAGLENSGLENDRLENGLILFWRHTVFTVCLYC